MIDCSKTENYFAEKQRMTKPQKNGMCKLDCEDCPLSFMNNGTNIECPYFETLYPQEAIKIVQKWSDEHPQKTYLSEFLNHYPNVKFRNDGTPSYLCPYQLGLMSKDDCRKDNDCVKCWNQPIEGGEE